MIRRVGRPGLIGTMARTAVVAGTAGAVVHHQQNKYAAKDQQAAEAAAFEQQQAQAQAAAAAPPPPAVDKTTELQKLGELKTQGILTEEEFAAEKAKILAS